MPQQSGDEASIDGLGEGRGMSSREQFEAWIAGTTNSDLHRGIMLDRHENGRYRHLATENKWEAWQEAMLKHSAPFIVTSDHRMMEMPKVEDIDAVAAMLQGADRPQNEPQNIPENIPATQFKPVADLYGLTSPTGGETSFTFDAVEARDFIDGGWSCQEYVELGRYQEALTDHSEDKLAMVDHSGDSNNMVEPVTTACKLRDAVDTIRNSGIAIDGEKILAERDALNSPVIPDGWVACSERMPDDDDFVYIWPRPDFGVELHVGQYCECHPKGDGWYAQVYEQNYGIEWCPITVTHWMPLPAAPQQEA